jgi:Flp pilus assembly protein TadD
MALMGRASFLSGDYAASDRALHEAIAMPPVASEAYVYLADTAERIGHTVDARDALVALDALEGDTAATDERARRAVRIGALSLRAGDARGAVTFLDRATANGRGDGQTYGLLAQARWQSGDPAGARAALARGLDLDPRNGELLRLTRTIK